MNKSITLNAIVYSFIILFIYAATSKILDYKTFEAQLGKSPLIMNYADTIVWLAPTSEYLVVVMLLLPRMTLIGLYGSFFLMVAFTFYITFILTFSPYVPCSCGGILNSLGWIEHLIFNIAFTLIALYGIIIVVKSEKKNPTLQNSLQ